MTFSNFRINSGDFNQYFESFTEKYFENPYYRNLTMFSILNILLVIVEGCCNFTTGSFCILSLHHLHKFQVF